MNYKNRQIIDNKSHKNRNHNNWHSKFQSRAQNVCILAKF